MKQCDYCAKELDSYHLMYCKDTDCEEKAMKFYETRRRTENVFGVINIAMVVFIMIGLITAVFSPVIGNFMVAGSLIVLAVTVLILPYAPESFYKKWRIKKTTFIVRIFGVLLIIGACGFSVLALYYNSK
ncbi:MAG: hypothetical protein IIY78_04555 [Clostridia bacterium]|nr:hypothetical protein [Clostridia bacterium]